MVTPAGVLLLLLQLAAFILVSLLFIGLFVFSRVTGASTPASSLKTTCVQNKRENTDKKSVQLVQRFTVKTVYFVTEHDLCHYSTCQKGETKAQHGCLKV